jgi:hypothetical protein
MELNYKREGGFIVMKADGEMPDELLKIIRAMEALVQECNYEEHMR